MPLFRRPDGVPVAGLPPLRRIMPLLMPTRGESVVWHEQLIDLTKTLPFIESWNDAHEAPLTLFQLVMFAIGRTFHERPGMNRFVSGGRLYQRNGVQLSFAAKKAFEDAAPIVTIKLDLPEDTDLEAFSARVRHSVAEGRTGPERAVDAEVRLATRLPVPMLSGLLWLLRKLDAWNLMPAAMIRPDPMYASAFLANLGSLGIDRTWHHLFEYGTVGLFAAVGVAGPGVVVGPSGQPEVKQLLSVRYTFDERVSDGFSAAKALDLVRRYVESPELLTRDRADERVQETARGR